MTAAEILKAIEESGGRVDLVGDRLKVRAPRKLVELAKAKKADILRHLEGQRYRYLLKRFNAKVINHDRLKEIEGGQRWRILGSPDSTKWTWRGARYRWQAVCHDGDHGELFESPMGKACGRCYLCRDSVPL